jgi:hypothetical protein
MERATERRLREREIQAAVGAVIPLAKYRELLQDGASWWESGGKPQKPTTTTPRLRGKWPFFQSGRRGSNPRRPPWQVDGEPNRP